MPRYADDGGDYSADSSVSAPPDSPSTEQYQPMPRQQPQRLYEHSHRAGLDNYHARATSFNSETDAHDEDEDTLTMPVPSAAVRRVSPRSSPALEAAPRGAAVSPPRSPIPAGYKKVMVGRPSSPHSNTTITTSPPPAAAAAADRTNVSPPRRTTLPPSLVAHGDARSRTPPPPPSPPLRSMPNATTNATNNNRVNSPSAHPVPRPAIVDSSGYHYSTRTHPSTHTTSNVPIPAPAPTATTLLQEQQQRQNKRGTALQETLQLPPQLERLSTPPPATAAASAATAHVQPAGDNSPQPYVPGDYAARSPSATQWQLTSPRDAQRDRGAVFEYASEAVNTLEQQYGEALQRLGTMHRLYDRLDTQNKALEEEVVKLRRVSETLSNGVAFGVYNSVRQVKHELKLLRQYVAVLCTGFSNTLEGLQQVVAEDVPRMLGTGTGYSALLPYGAAGRLRQPETRVSVGHATNKINVGSGHTSSNGGGVSAMAESQLYRPEYWWNAVSPQPLRPPPRDETPPPPPSFSPPLHEECSREVVELTQPSSTEADAAALALVPAHDRRDGNDKTVPYDAYRRLQVALADAQRRVVELEQRTSSQQRDYDERVTQLKIAHRARESRLEDELSIWKRASVTVGAAATQGGSVAESPSAVTVDVNTLAQLLTSLQQHPQSVTGSAALATPPPMERTVDAAQRQHDDFVRQRQSASRGPARQHRGMVRGDDEEDDGMVHSHDPCSTAEETHSEDDSGAYRHYEDRVQGDGGSSDNSDGGSSGPRRLYDGRGRHTGHATALGGRAGYRETGRENARLGVPDRYSRAEAAQRAGRARQAMGDEHHHQSGGGGGERRLTSAGATVPLAYDRLLHHHHHHRGHDSSSPRTFTGQDTRAARGVRAAPTREATRRAVAEEEEEEEAMVVRHSSRSARRGSEAARSGGADGRYVDPGLLRSVLAQLADEGNAHGQRYATKHARVGAGSRAGMRASSKSDRLAQGLWAQEALKERHCL